MCSCRPQGDEALVRRLVNESSLLDDFLLYLIKTVDRGRRASVRVQSDVRRPRSLLHEARPFSAGRIDGPDRPRRGSPVTTSSTAMSA